MGSCLSTISCQNNVQTNSCITKHLIPSLRASNVFQADFWIPKTDQLGEVGDKESRRAADSSPQAALIIGPAAESSPLSPSSPPQHQSGMAHCSGSYSRRDGKKSCLLALMDRDWRQTMNKRLNLPCAGVDEDGPLTNPTTVSSQNR